MSRPKLTTRLITSKRPTSSVMLSTAVAKISRTAKMYMNLFRRASAQASHARMAALTNIIIEKTSLEPEIPPGRLLP